MASTPVSNKTVHGGDNNTDKSYFQKTVCLYDWWLIKSQNNVGGGQRLAVGGVGSEKEEARRVFSSAPIAKRFDVFTLDTADGICIVLKGFINKERTIENGFPSEIFAHFLFGFPPHWEQWAAKFLGGDSTPSSIFSGSTSDADKSPTNPGKTTVEQVSGDDRHDAEVAGQCFSKLSMNVAADNSKVDDLPKHAAKEDTGRVNIGSSDFQSIGRHKHLGGSQKKPVSRSVMKHKMTKSSPAAEAVESLVGEPGATTQSGAKVNTSEKYPRGQVSRSVSRVTRGKGKEKQMAGTGLNSERKTVDSVPAVSKTLRKTSQLDYYKARGKSMSHPSDSELREPNEVTVIKRLDFGCLEDDLQHSGHAKQGQNGGNITAQVGKGESDAKKENTSRKKTKRKTTCDTEETPTPEVNEEVTIASPDSLNLKRSRSGRLLLPTMEFWRNQVPIYDMDRKITGIQEESPIAAKSRGSRSGSQKSKRRR